MSSAGERPRSSSMHPIPLISDGLIANIALVIAWLVISLGVIAVPAKAQENLSDVGNFYPMLQDYIDNSDMSLSYLSHPWPDIEQWRIKGRAKMQELLAYDTDAEPLDPEILKTIREDGYTKYLVRYNITPNRTTEAYLLIPDGLKEPAPAIVALHDHGGFYYFGKEKITSVESPPDILREFIETSYGGRTYADELARRGFVVLCPDAFYFGSQRIDIDKTSRYFRDQFPQLKTDDENAYIKAFNRFSSRHETMLAKTIFAAGTTWPGILFQGDRASLDYLLTRPEVDKDRIGCMGLSIGGFRSAHLFALDPRIKAAVVAGWMTTFTMQLFDKLRHHTWMVYVPGQLAYLDLPDVVSLNAPNPLFVINCGRDQLYTREAMQAAGDKIEAIYGKMGAPDRFKFSFYDVPHSLNVEMQDDAIAWMERWLR